MRFLDSYVSSLVEANKWKRSWSKSLIDTTVRSRIELQVSRRVAVGYSCCREAIPRAMWCQRIFHGVPVPPKYSMYTIYIIYLHWGGGSM